MFNLLLNTVNGFYDVFLNCTFKGAPVVFWGLVVFLLGCFVRFLLPLFHMPMGTGMIVSASRTSDVGQRTIVNNYYGRRR